jgi:hypothetical protein
MRAKHLRRLKELGDKKALVIKYKKTAGSHVLLNPGIITPVSFMELPLVWCPFSLADEQGGIETLVTLEVGLSRKLSLPEETRFLTEHMIDSLGSMLGEEITSSTLTLMLLHTEKDGMDAPSFDKKVKGKKNVLVVVRATTGWVFGAFIADELGKHGGWITGSDSNFVFTLGGCTEPTSKKKLKKKKKQRAAKPNRNWDAVEAKFIRNPAVNQFLLGSGCGLHIGGSGGFVLFCSLSISFPNSDFVLAPGFESVTVTPTTVAGGKGLAYDKIEVYELI